MLICDNLVFEVKLLDYCFVLKPSFAEFLWRNSGKQNNEFHETIEFHL